MTSNRTSEKQQVHRLSRSLSLTLFLTALIAVPIPALADGPHLMSTKVAENLYMLTGDGGNIGVMIGDDGTFLIDDQMAPALPELLALINQLGGEPPRFLINTHFHFDHTGGNELLGGTGTTIFSHEMARTRLADGSDIPLFDLSFQPMASDGLPVVTFKDSMSFHLNGDIMRAVHTPRAHTDGDLVVFFEMANVVHAGDVFFNGIYPVIDTHNGGTLQGTISAVEMLRDHTDEHTKVIPGHGSLGSRDDLLDYLAMLQYARDELSKLKGEGKTRQQVVDLRPLDQFDAKWSGGFFSTDIWTGLMFDAL
ncbi:MBL fold metallo-hydrolase [uncultured Roseobacter sp.]|uniref:MBL fold metallo-hydrolase n=1 Tax=uncultured Roseobacter sp. TaxID=114847 RepID=UPI002632715A|nr:MBL fold metallo-hydrolase [uncultured Roseobacter sp.]